MLRNITEAATTFSPPLKPSNFILSGREHNTQQTAVKTILTLAANTFIQFKQNLNAANNIQSIGADMGGGGPHQEWSCVGDAISRNTRSIIIRLNTYEDLWLRVSRKSVVAVPMEAAPRARSCRVMGQSTFNRMRQPQYNFTNF